jgi:hypothetical protein
MNARGVEFGLLPLRTQLELLHYVTRVEHPLVNLYTVSFMKLMTEKFRHAECYVQTAPYWRLRRCRSPLDLLFALNALGQSDHEACLLLELVERCFAETLEDLPPSDTVEKQFSGVHGRLSHFRKQHSAILLMRQITGAVEELGVEETRLLCTNVLETLDYFNT